MPRPKVLPLVAVTGDWVRREGEWSVELGAPYLEAVRRGGGEPVVLAPGEPDPAGILDRVAALVLSGGGHDLEPSLYGERRRPGCGRANPLRSRFELSLARRAWERDLPTLGICGGAQVLNVARGGSLIQDLPTELPHALRHRRSRRGEPTLHPVDVSRQGRLAGLLGIPRGGEITVNSSHHQAVRALGEGLIPTALSPDGVIEAIEAPERRFWIGVQWHPERLIDRVPSMLGLFRGLLAPPRSS